MTEQDTLEPRPQDQDSLQALADLIRTHRDPTLEGRQASDRAWVYTFASDSSEIVRMLAGSGTAMSDLFDTEAFSDEEPDTFMLARHAVEDGLGISLVAMYSHGSTQEFTVERTPATSEPYRIVRTITDRSKPGDPAFFKIYEFESDKERQEHTALLTLMLQRDIFLATDQSEG